MNVSLRPFLAGLLGVLAACQPAGESRASPAPPAPENAAAEAMSAEAAALPAAATVAQTGDSGIEEVCFEPEDDCIGVMVREIGQARDEVLVMAFLFSNRRIMRALSEAEERGIEVRMIVSYAREGAGRVVAVQRDGVEVLTRDELTQHSKYLIIDRRQVITGSQNFTYSSQNNSENLLVIGDPATVRAYLRNWERRAAQSRPSSMPRAAADEGEE